MLITTPEQYMKLLIRLDMTDRVAIDTETTGLQVYKHDVLRGISVAIGDYTCYLNVSHPGSPTFDPQPLLSALDKFDGTILMHNAPFDMNALRLAGRIDWTGKDVYDTQVVDWLLDENQRSHRLKDIGARLFGADAKAESKHLAALRKGRSLDDIYRELRAGDDPRFTGMGTAAAAREEARRIQPTTRRDWATFTAQDIHEYAEQDTRLTWDLWEWQQAELWSQRGEAVDVNPDVGREMQYQHVLADMVYTGIKVDTSAAELALREYEYRIEAIQYEIGEDVNLNSPGDLRKLLYDRWGLTTRNRTDSGLMSTNKDTLAELEGSHPGVAAILEHRQMSKMISAYLRPLLDKQDDQGRVHSFFSSSRTVTGRLASSDPNLQTIPKQSTNALVRSLFVPAEGYELWEFDLSQAELRVAASLANDTNLQGRLLAGDDLHGVLVERVWGTEDELGPMAWEKYRTLAKNVNYGYQYGIQARKLSTYLAKGRAVTPDDVRQAQMILDGFGQEYPQLARLMSGLQSYADQHGYVPLHVPGRYRRYRGPGYHDYKTYTALNAVVQGGVGEFMKDVQLALAPEMPGLGGRICLQVHDSLVMELAPGQGDVVASLLQTIADDLNPFRMRMLWDAKQWGH